MVHQHGTGISRRRINDNSMRTIIFFCFILAGLFGPACMTTAVAQGRPSRNPAPSANLGFESGLIGWIKAGLSRNSRIDTTHPYKGSACARLGAGYAALMKRIEVGQFSVVQFNAYLRLGAAGVKG